MEMVLLKLIRRPVCVCVFVFACLCVCCPQMKESVGWRRVGGEGGEGGTEGNEREKRKGIGVCGRLPKTNAKASKLKAGGRTQRRVLSKGALAVHEVRLAPLLAAVLL